MHLPDDRHDNSRADDLLEVAEIAGLVLVPWQEYTLVESAWTRKPARRNAKPKWSATRLLVEVARQNGKGDVKLVRQLAGLFVWRERLQIHTAHLYPTCYEHFRKIVDIVENVPDFTRQLNPRTGVTSGSQNQAIELRTGERIKFMARSGKSGRGLTADTVYLDEAFDVTPAMIGALEYALRARPNAQVWNTTSAPHLHSAYLHNLNARAKRSTEEDPRFLALAWLNDQDTDPGDIEAWYRANPTLGDRIAFETMQTEYANALDNVDLMAEFKREALSIPEVPGQTDAPIAIETWRARKDVKSTIARNRVAAIDVSPDRSRSSVALAGTNADGMTHVEVVGNDAGADWTVAKVVELGCPVVIDPGSPAGGLLGNLERAGVTVVSISGRQYVQACGAFFDDVVEGKLVHVSQLALDAALTGARKADVAEGAWKWDRRRATNDITPLVAVTLARWGIDHLPTDYSGGFYRLDDFLTDEE